MSQINPDEYMQDARGNLVNKRNIKPIDLLRHEFVLEQIGAVLKLNNELRDVKRKMLGDIAAFCDMSAEKYGQEWGGKKGNVTLMSYDGRYKLVRSMEEGITFDERLEVGRELINKCLAEWTQGSPAELQAVVADAFRTDSAGRLSPGRILGLRRLKIDDPRWREAMEAIADSVQVTGSRPYVRAYERNEQGRYVPISMDMAGV